MADGPGRYPGSRHGVAPCSLDCVRYPAGPALAAGGWLAADADEQPPAAAAAITVATS